MSDNWLPGEAARITLSVTDIDGLPIDASALRLRVLAPDETVVTYEYGSGEVVRSALGEYHADIALTASGVWSWRWESDAPRLGAAEDSLLVQPSVIPNLP